MKIKKALSLTGIIATVVFVASLSGCASSPQKDAGDRLVLETEVKVALDKFYKEATNARKIVEIAEGVLVCPTITKAGFVFGGAGGTCALQIHGKTVDFYRAAAFKAGLIAGGETYSLLAVFNDADTLVKFREDKRKWQLGGNLSVVVAKKGASGGFDTRSIGGAPVTVYVYGQSGFMGDISVDGSTLSKL